MMMMIIIIIIIIIIIVYTQNENVKFLSSFLSRPRIIYLTYFTLKFGNTEDYFIYGIYSILLFLYFNTLMIIFKILCSNFVSRRVTCLI